MKHNEETRRRAMELYVNDGMDLAAVAAELGVGRNTVGQWKKEDALEGVDWARLRVAERLGKARVSAATQEFMELFLNYHREVLEDVTSTADLDAQAKVAAISDLGAAYAKSVRAFGLGAPGLRELAIAKDAVWRLKRFVSQEDPELAKALDRTLGTEFTLTLLHAYEC